MARNSKTQNLPEFANADVHAVFNSYPTQERNGLLILRSLIFQIAHETPKIGKLDEVLRWNQPAYITAERKSGSTLRLGLPKTGGFALYAHCQSSIIPNFREAFPNDFSYEGNRAIHFFEEESIQPEKLCMLIRHALTYHTKPAKLLL